MISDRNKGRNDKMRDKMRAQQSMQEEAERVVKNPAMAVLAMMGMIGFNHNGALTMRTKKVEPLPIPPKQVLTAEQEEELERLYLDRSPEGRKAYKAFRKSIGLNA